MADLACEQDFVQLPVPLLQSILHCRQQICYKYSALIGSYATATNAMPKMVIQDSVMRWLDQTSSMHSWLDTVRMTLKQQSIEMLTNCNRSHTISAEHQSMNMSQCIAHQHHPYGCNKGCSQGRMSVCKVHVSLASPYELEWHGRC